MREIKFRAWIKSVKAMSDWNTILKECDRFSLLNDPNFQLMQFTGLLDKEGKEIYEGDILAPMANDFTPKYMGNWVVVYDGGTFAAEGNSERISTWIPYWIPEMQVEVIGNIYENAELLK